MKRRPQSSGFAKVCLFHDNPALSEALMNAKKICQVATRAKSFATVHLRSVVLQREERWSEQNELFIAIADKLERESGILIVD